MKRTLSFMVMALALLLTQCRKPEVKFPTPSATEDVTVSMTVTAGPGSKTNIDADGRITWSSGDKLYVGDGSKCIGCLTLTSGADNPTGTFSGNVTLTKDTRGEQTFHFYYLGRAERTLENDGTSVEVSFAEQTGLLNDLGSCHVGYGSAAGTVKDGIVTGINVTLVSKVAIAYFSFKDGTNPYTSALTLSGVSNKMTVKFNGAGFSYEGSGDCISLTNTSASEKYVMLVPTGGTGDVALSFDGGCKTGGATIEGGIQSNKFYWKESAKEVTLAAPTVNFGTPNLNWSVCNLGATNGAKAESWYGDYYAWGETAPYYQNGSWCEHPSHDSNINFDQTVGYGWKNYIDGSSESWDNYKDWKPYGSSNILTSDYDAATAAWGVGWRMPTRDEWKSLYDNNTFEWLAAGASSTNVTSFTAVAAGCLVVKGGKNSVTLDPTVYMFLPASGYFGDTNPIYDDSGTYWSRSLYVDIHYNSAVCLVISDDYNNPEYHCDRYLGFPVRPVRAAR